MLHFETLARPGTPVDAGSGGTSGELPSPLVAQGHRNLRPLCLCGAPGSVLAAAATALITPAYVATVELVVNPTGLNLVEKDPVRRPEAIDSGASALDTQAKILSSDKVLSRVIAQFHLGDNPLFKRRPLRRDGGIPEWAFVTLGAATGTGDGSRCQSALDRLRTMVTLRRTERTFVTDIVTRTPSPDFGTVMVTTVGLLFVMMRGIERTRLHDRTHGRPLPRAARYRVRGAIAPFGAGRASAASTDAGAVTSRAPDSMRERECHVP